MHTSKLPRVAGGLLALLALTTALLLRVSGGPDLSACAPILSDSESERRRGLELLLDNRQRQIEELRAIVRSPVAQGEPFYQSNTPRNIAIRLLGRFCAKEAVGDLIPRLVPTQGQDFTLYDLHLLVLPHAGYALTEIGLPAVRPLLERLATEGVRAEGQGSLECDLGTACLRTLIVIEGPQETERLLTRLIEEEPDATKKQNLQAALTLLKDPDFSVAALTSLRKQTYRLP